MKKKTHKDIGNLFRLKKKKLKQLKIEYLIYLRMRRKKKIIIN